jgi:alkylhydroperoxidase/carboxymuconolactone decarboxylase family protein YurZ
MPSRLVIHVHSNHQAGATPEEIYEVINHVGPWADGAADRMVWRPGDSFSDLTYLLSYGLWN